MKRNPCTISLRKKCPYSELFWSYFPAFGLNTERYRVSLRIQSECGKIRTRITPNTDTFHAVYPETIHFNSPRGLYDIFRALQKDMKQWNKVFFPTLKGSGDEIEMMMVYPWDNVPFLHLLKTS